MVFIFIFATGGLLAWALLKPWVEKYIEVSKSSITNKRKQRHRSKLVLFEPITFSGSLFVEIAANICLL